MILDCFGWKSRLGDVMHDICVFELSEHCIELRSHLNAQYVVSVRKHSRVQAFKDLKRGTKLDDTKAPRSLDCICTTTF